MTHWILCNGLLVLRTVTGRVSPQDTVLENHSHRMTFQGGRHALRHGPWVSMLLALLLRALGKEKSFRRGNEGSPQGPVRRQVQSPAGQVYGSLGDGKVTSMSVLHHHNLCGVSSVFCECTKWHSLQRDKGQCQPPITARLPAAAGSDVFDHQPHGAEGNSGS